jgi:hypothetical protein
MAKQRVLHRHSKQVVECKHRMTQKCLQLQCVNLTGLCLPWQWWRRKDSLSEVAYRTDSATLDGRIMVTQLSVGFTP